MDELIFTIKGIESWKDVSYSIYNEINELVYNNTVLWGFSSNNSKLRLPEEILPGHYSLELHNYSRTSNRIDFEIKRPVIHSFGGQEAYKRGHGVELVGEFLPNTPIAYQLRHESGRVIKRGTYAYEFSFEPENYKTNKIIGKGQYNLELVFGDEVIQTNYSFMLDDYFAFENTCDEFDFYESKGQVCFANNNKLYYLLKNEAAMRVININSGEVQKVNTNIRLIDSYIAGELDPDLCIFPAIINDKIYIRHNYKVYAFNFDSYQWDHIPIYNETDSIVRIANINNQLVVTNSHNEAWKYNGLWEKIAETQFDYYTFGNGEYYYTGYNHGFSKISLSDFSNSGFISSPLGRLDTYYGFRHLFEYKGDLYECLNGNYELEIARLSPNDDSFIMLDPRYISEDTYKTRFFPDINGEVFYLVDNVIYRFKPDENF